MYKTKLLVFIFLISCKNDTYVNKNIIDTLRWSYSSNAPKIYTLKKNKYKHINLDLTIIPQFNDPILKKCNFYIIIRHIAQSYTIYNGPFKKNIVLKSVPYKYSYAEIEFIAYNKKTSHYFAWYSKNYSYIFINKPLIIELYNNFNKDADAWYKVYPKSE